MMLKFGISYFLLKIIIAYLIVSPILISGHDATLSKQNGQDGRKTCHQRPQPSNGEQGNDIQNEGNYCDDLKLETIQTYAVPIDELGKGLSRPILPPEGSLLPPWINATLYNEGIIFSKKHFFSVFLFPIAAISLFLSNPLITPLLIATGKSSTPDSSNKRYVATVLHMKLWYENLLQREEEEDFQNGDDLLNPFVLQSLYNIRSVHFMLIKNYPWKKTNSTKPGTEATDKFTTNPELWAAYKADLEGSDIPQKFRKWPKYMTNLRQKDGNQDKTTAPPHYLNQLSLAMTQFFLGGLQTLIPERGGIIADDKEHEGFLHMWAVFGYAIGIEDQFNVALQPSLKAAKEYYQEMMNRFLYPSLFYMKDDPDAWILYEAFLKGFVQAFAGEGGQGAMSEEQFMLLAFEDVIGIPCPNLRARLPMTQKVLRNVVLQNAIPMVRRFDWVREFMNGRFKSGYCEKSARKLFGIDANDLEQVVQKSYA